MHRNHYDENVNRAAAVKNGLWMLRKELSEMSTEINDLNLNRKLRAFSETAKDLAVMQNDVQSFIEGNESQLVG